jgi:hypothetical protein
MVSGEKVSISGAILTKRVVSATMSKDTESIRSYVPRSQRIISWIERNADDIDNRKSGNLKISFKNDSLQICEEVFHQVS